MLTVKLGEKSKTLLDIIMVNVVTHICLIFDNLTFTLLQINCASRLLFIYFLNLFTYTKLALIIFSKDIFIL